MNKMLENNTYIYDLRYYEKDLNKNLKLVSLLNFMQDAATLNADVKGFGLDFISAKNLAWFVLKYKIVFYEHINEMKNLTIKTKSRGASKLFAYRDFYFYNEEKLFARANSLWALVDFDTKKMVKPQDAIKNIELYEKQDDDLDFEKIQVVQNFDVEKEFQIRFDDIDINQHVNNSNYLEWALDTFEFDFRCNNVPKSVDISYKKDIAYDGKILSKMYFDNDEYSSTHLIQNAQNGDDLCHIKIYWNKIN